MLPLHVPPPTGTGQHRRRYPRRLHTPPMRTWIPHQSMDVHKGVYGNELNNPYPYLHHRQAVTSSGRVLVLPAFNDMHKMWEDNMIQDSQIMRVEPDDTHTGTFAGAIPNVLMPPVWMPSNNSDQLGTGRL
jgi:hypothetical protein